MKFEISQNVSPADVQMLLDGLTEYNKEHVVRDRSEITILAREEDRIVGGAYCQLTWDWLYLEYLWLAKEQRGTGLGKQLMKAVEEEAQKRNCIGVHLDTFSFQAPRFYEELGYEVFGAIEDHPKGHTRYFFKKTFGSINK